MLQDLFLVETDLVAEALLKLHQGRSREPASPDYKGTRQSKIESSSDIDEDLDEQGMNLLISEYTSKIQTREG